MKEKITYSVESINRVIAALNNVEVKGFASMESLMNVRSILMNNGEISSTEESKEEE